MLIIGILELPSIQLRVDTQKKIQELISSQNGEEDIERSHGLGPGKHGKCQKELLKEW